MDGDSDESSILALLTLSWWCLPNDSLGEKGIYAPIYGRTVGLDVTNIHIHWLVVVKNFHIIVYTQKTKDEGESHSKQTNH